MDRILIKVPSTIGFMTDLEDCVTHAVCLDMNDTFAIKDYYLFHSYNQKYSKYNGSKQPVVEVRVNAKGNHYYEFVRILPECFTLINGLGFTTIVEVDDWETRNEPIVDWETDNLYNQFLYPLFDFIDRADMITEYKEKYMKDDRSTK
jgi:hypothetical protein